MDSGWIYHCCSLDLPVLFLGFTTVIPWIYHYYSLDPVLSLVFSPWFGFGVEENQRVRRGRADYPIIDWRLNYSLPHRTGRRKEEIPHLLSHTHPTPSA